MSKTNGRPTKEQPYGEGHILKEHEYAKKERDNINLFDISESAITNKGMVIGRTYESNRVLGLNMEHGLNRCSATIAPPGGGKTRAVIMNMISSFAKSGHSMVIMDPKGSILKMVAAWLKGKYGYNIQVADFKHQKNSNSWDMLGGCDSLVNTQEFVDFFMAFSGESDPYFDGVVSNFLKVLCMFVKETYPEEKRNFGEVRKLIGLDIAEIQNILEQALLSEDNKKKKWATAYTIFKNSGNAIPSAISGLGNRTQIWDIPEIYDITSVDEIDMTLIAKEKTATFICVPDTKKTYNSISSTLVACIMEKIFDYADNTPDEKTDVPVEIIIDEFPTLGKVKDIEDKFATGRSRDIGIHIVVQNIPQMYEVYGENLTENILSNCEYIIIMSTNSPTTGDYTEKLFGKTTTEVRSKSYTNTGSVLVGEREVAEGESKNATSILYGYNLMKLEDDLMCLKVRGMDPILVRKMDISENPEALDMYKVDSSELIPPWRIKKEPELNIINKYPVNNQNLSFSAVPIEDFLLWVYSNKSKSREVIKNSNKYGNQRDSLIAERKRFS